jgi:hypothetical protein
MCFWLDDFLHFGILFILFFSFKNGIFFLKNLMKTYKYVIAITWYLCMIGPPNIGEGQVSNHMEFFGKFFKMWTFDLENYDNK